MNNERTVAGPEDSTLTLALGGTIVCPSALSEGSSAEVTDFFELRPATHMSFGVIVCSFADASVTFSCLEMLGGVLSRRVDPPNAAFATLERDGDSARPLAIDVTGLGDVELESRDDTEPRRSLGSLKNEEPYITPRARIDAIVVEGFDD